MPAGVFTPDFVAFGEILRHRKMGRLKKSNSVLALIGKNLMSDVFHLLIACRLIGRGLLGASLVIQ